MSPNQSCEAQLSAKQEQNFDQSFLLMEILKPALHKRNTWCITYHEKEQVKINGHMESTCVSKNWGLITHIVLYNQWRELKCQPELQNFQVSKSPLFMLKNWINCMHQNVWITAYDKKKKKKKKWVKSHNPNLYPISE